MENLRTTIDTLSEQVALWRAKFGQLEQAAKERIEELQKKLAESEKALSDAKQELEKEKANSPERKEAAAIVAKAEKVKKGVGANDARNGSRTG